MNISSLSFDEWILEYEATTSVVSQESADITHNFVPHEYLSQDRNCIAFFFMEAVCYLHPLKCGTWVFTWERMLACQGLYSLISNWLTESNWSAPYGSSLALMISCIVSLSPTSAPNLAPVIWRVKVSFPSGTASFRMTTVAEDWVTPLVNVATMLVPKKSEAASPWIYMAAKN